jgi:predicted adenine nucleotide alpha hydrolase (AANH) superfamily ATPase
MSDMTKFLLRKDLLFSRLTTFNDKAESYHAWKSSLENDRRRAQRWVRCYPDELSLVAQQACEQVVKTLMSGLALHISIY